MANRGIETGCLNGRRRRLTPRDRNTHAGSLGTERRRSRTDRAVGYTTAQVLKAYVGDGPAARGTPGLWTLKALPAQRLPHRSGRVVGGQ
jgi:hypothetical protein